METTVAEHFRCQDLRRSREIEDLVRECEILEADPIVAQHWIPLPPPSIEPRDSDHWESFLDQACNRGADPSGRFVDRSAWLYEDCYLSDVRVRSRYWWTNRDRVPNRDMRFNH